MQVQPYLFFEGRAEEALNFYRDALGAKVEMLMHYKDGPQDSPSEGCAPSAVTPAAMQDKVMHASLRIGDSLVMLSDGHCSGKPSFQGVSLSLTAASEAEARRLFDALGNGGQVQMPMEKTFFSPAFGMVADRFGVNWMVLVQSPA